MLDTRELEAPDKQQLEFLLQKRWFETRQKRPAVLRAIALFSQLTAIGIGVINSWFW